MSKKWWFWIMVALFIVIVILIGVIITITISSNSKIAEKENQLISIKEENNKVQDIYMELNEKISKLQKDEEQKKINDKIAELEKNKKEIEQEIKDKEKEKTSLEKDLEKLNGDVIKAKGKAKSYPAGQLVAGKDFEIGRYKIYGGSSNFIVYSRFGDLEVNTILGDWGVDEYVYTFNEGDEVDAHSSFKMQPIN